MQYTIPAFLSKEFSSCKTKEQKDELLRQYRVWKNSDMTGLFAGYLEAELKNTLEQNDKKIDFISWFQKKEFNSYYKGVRQTLRKLLKQTGE